ncbi:MAG: MerR family transcriptional regulator [Acidimicrobiia bacterium]
MKVELLPIGAIASQTGASVSAIRYYEQLGMIEAKTRVGGKRRFDPDTIGRVSFIRRAQEVGFTLGEVRLILDDGAGEWPDLVDEKIADLAKRRKKLDWMILMLSEIRECGCDAVASCPRSDVFQRYVSDRALPVASTSR